MEYESKDINEAKAISEQSDKTSVNYEAYYNNVLLKEQPFYRNGMDSCEINREIEYLNNNLQSFYNGNYVPLWKQEWLK